MTCPFSRQKTEPGMLTVCPTQSPNTRERINGAMSRAYFDGRHLPEMLMSEGDCFSWALLKRLPPISGMRYTRALCRPRPQPANIPDTSYPEYLQGENNISCNIYYSASPDIRLKPHSLAAYFVQTLSIRYRWDFDAALQP